MLITCGLQTVVLVVSLTAFALSGRRWAGSDWFISIIPSDGRSGGSLWLGFILIISGFRLAEDGSDLCEEAVLVHVSFGNLRSIALAICLAGSRFWRSRRSIAALRDRKSVV